MEQKTEIRQRRGLHDWHPDLREEPAAAAAAAAAGAVTAPKGEAEGEAGAWVVEFEGFGHGVLDGGAVGWGFV
jgi:hypothetical protein